MVRDLFKQFFSLFESFLVLLRFIEFLEHHVEIITNEDSSMKSLQQIIMILDKTSLRLNPWKAWFACYRVNQLLLLTFSDTLIFSNISNNSNPKRYLLFFFVVLFLNFFFLLLSFRILIPTEREIEIYIYSD